MLTTLTGEAHGLGLLMVECLLALQGARCINLGTQMPVLEVVRATQAHGPHVVGLSFSSSFPARLAPDLVAVAHRAAAGGRVVGRGHWLGAQLARVDAVRVMGFRGPAGDVGERKGRRVTALSRGPRPFRCWPNCATRRHCSSCGPSDRRADACRRSVGCWGPSGTNHSIHNIQAPAAPHPVANDKIAVTCRQNSTGT